MEVWFEKTINGQCLVLGLGHEDKVIDFQIEMIRHNPHPQVLPIVKRTINNRAELCYQLGDYLSLDEFYKDSMKLSEAIVTIESIICCLNICSNYLLYAQCFLLDTRYIYIHPRNKLVTLVYQPIKHTEDLDVKLKGLLDMIVSKVKLEEYEKEKDGFRYLKEYQNKQRLNIAELKELIRELKISSRMNKIENLMAPAVLKPFRLSDEIVSNNNCQGEREAIKKLNEKPPKMRILVFLLFQALLILVIACFMEELDKLGDPVIIYGLAIVFLTVCNIMVIDRLVLKHKRPKNENNLDKKLTGWQGQLADKLAEENEVLKKEILYNISNN